MCFFWIFIKKHKYGIAVFLIIFLAFILRFYGYANRWGLASDQARDVLVVREGLKSFKLPLIGPFASAGQFVYGPQWFWMLMVMVGIYPYAVITPWIMQTLLYVATVGLMITIGKDICNKQFALILGLLTAISTAQLSNSTNLTSPSMVGILSIVTVYFFIRYIKTGFIKNAFWMAFMIATSINVHFQAIGLLVLVPISFLLDKKKGFRKFFSLLGGIIIPFIPLIFFDINNNFFESKNWIEYMLRGQYAIYIPNRWLTYAGVYWPSIWSKIIGGEVFLGYLVPALFATFMIVAIIRRKFSRVILGIALAFSSIFLLLRYYRGERIDSNLAFLHPLVIIVTGWCIVKLFKLNCIVGLDLFAIIFVLTMKMDLVQIKSGENLTAIQVGKWSDALIKTFPNQKFSVYSYNFRDIHKSLPLVLFLESKNKIGDEGLQIGCCISTDGTDFKYPRIWGNKGEYQILDLEATSSAHLSKEGWAFINTSQIYKSTVEWYKE
jgi:hypothetical protein